MSEKSRIQLRSSTLPNRYPLTFAAAAEQARQAREGGLHVLSFGCSTGAECVSLADLYFNRPEDRIVGVDISVSAIRRARTNNPHPRVKYLLQNDQRLTRLRPFDVIFAMSVLCVWPAVEEGDSISELFPFSRFEEIANGLDRRLRRGGLLVIYNASYRLSDLAMASRYEAIEDPTGKSGFVSKFDRTGKPLVAERYRYSMFRKIKSAPRAPAEDLPARDTGDTVPV